MGCSTSGCGSCSTPQGCGDKGHCASGSCNKLNTFDWLAGINLPEAAELDVIEVSFKNGARKEFYRKPHYIHVALGDFVTVESPSGGFDIGKVSLSGELVRLQMKKKRVKENAPLSAVLRLANERDLERLEEARALEKETMVQARVIARSLNLQMKIGDVEFQGDKRKVTLYYTADGRIDFRELIRLYAREFKVKIEMRQIGARQESARIGGIGACGRELCCSTWLSDFKSVSTVAARYQNLAINQSKLSGQCGRLKCCLNYELTAYLDALRDFPRQADHLQTERGTAHLVKTDIFKRLMYYVYREGGSSEFYPVPVERVKAILALNHKQQRPSDLLETIGSPSEHRKAKEIGFIDGSGSIELPAMEKRKRNRKKKARPEGPAAAAIEPRQGPPPAPEGQAPPMGQAPRNRPPRRRPNGGQPGGQAPQHPSRPPKPQRPRHDNPPPPKA